MIRKFCFKKIEKKGLGSLVIGLENILCFSQMKSQRYDVSFEELIELHLSSLALTWAPLCLLLFYSRSRVKSNPNEKLLRKVRVKKVKKRERTRITLVRPKKVF